MLPMLLKPRAVASASAPTYSTQGYTRLWGATAKAGAVSGTVASDTGLYAVKWWDGSTEILSSGSTFSKSGSGSRAFEVYPAALATPDDSSNALSATLNGGAAISSAQSKFGGASLFAGGVGATVQSQSYLSNWESDDWTIEMWLRPISNTGYVPLFYPASRLNIHMYNTGELYLNNGVDGTGGLVISDAISAGAWQHVAAVRQSGVSSVYVNGVRLAFGNVPYGTASSGVVDIAQGLNGYIDDLRVVRGSAVYSGASFTPPTSALTAISGTVLLLHFDSSGASPGGGFDGFNVSGNEITSLRAESVTLSTSAGYSQYVSWVKHYGVNYDYIPGVMEQGNLSSNSLTAAALDQFYTDLLSGTGALYVESNAGTASDTPSIATTKGYTVYGSA